MEMATRNGSPGLQYTSMCGIPAEMGMMWMSDMPLSYDPSVMMIEAQPDNPFYTDHQPSYEDVQERVNVNDVEGYTMLEDYDQLCDVTPRISTSTATQTTSVPSRKIKPIKHPGLKLKTPIAYQKDTDPSVIPIQKDGMAVCEKCGAIGVKHAFYTKERRFCSLVCAREYSEIERANQATQKPQSYDPPINEIEAEKQPMVDSMDDPSKDHMNAISNAVGSPFPTPVLLDEPMSPVLKRNRPELANTYEWKSQLSEPGFVAAPASCFKHAPLADCWDNITVGMKVEVENTDCDDFSESFPDSFWVATVLKLAGYHALLRYEGFGQNDSKDFWVNLCSSKVHPVGWCATRGKPLIPPKTIEDKYKDWKEFLVKRLTGARTLPSNFYAKVSESLVSRFRCGLNLEVVDKNRISRVKVARIEKIVGKRLHVKYFNADVDDNGFWCHEDSPLIHPVGWARRVGHAIAATRTFLDRCSSGKLNENDATEEFFIAPRPVSYPPDMSFEIGMKLEAVDPLNLSSICVATVMKVLKEDYIMIRIDSYESDAQGTDWFCYHASSPCIFPPGFCDQNSISLTPPKGYENKDFQWNNYLKETNCKAAPLSLFNREIPAHGFVVGMRLEAADLMDPRLVCVGTVSRVVGRLLKVHFDGWEEEYDQWLDCESPDVYPVGWCHVVGHKLEGPRVPTGKSPKAVKKKPRRRHKRGKGSPGTVPSKRIPVPVNPLPSIPSTTDSKPSCNDRLPKEPAQATKVAVENHTGEGFPDGSNVASREPEAGMEPAGPDQSLPVSTEPSPIPRGRTATSYINTTSSNMKLIPRLVDATGSSETGELVPSEWNVFDVAQFLRVNDCATYCDSFSKKKIDGLKLLSLTKDQIIDLTGMKVGPSLKIYDLIQQLKIKVNPAQERLKASLKKML